VLRAIGKEASAAAAAARRLPTVARARRRARNVACAKHHLVRGLRGKRSALEVKKASSGSLV